MAVYVDKQHNRYRGMVMCHMLADTLEELHAMAERIGMRREWFQGDASTPHYDVCLMRRGVAIQNGAVEIGRRETVALIRKLRLTAEQPLLRNNGATVIPRSVIR